MAARPEPNPESATTAADRFLSRVQSAWQDVNDCTEAISAVSGSVAPAPAPHSTLQQTRDWYEQSTRVLLVEPVGSFLRLQPFRRVWEAVHTCDQECVSAQGRPRVRIDARFERVLLLAALNLCEPWRIWRGGNQPSEWRAWHQRRAKFSSEAGNLLAQYKRWTQDSTPRAIDSAYAVANPQDDVWWKWQNALLATLKAELTLRDLTLAWFDTFRKFVDDTVRESEELRSLTRATLAWLEATPQTGAPAPESSGLITPQERLRGWALPIDIAADKGLPERVDLLVGGRKPTMHSAGLRGSFAKAFDTYARTPMRSVVERCWRQSAAGLRQVEEAKQMISYWNETSAARPEEATHLTAEARHNAIAALNDQLKVVVETTTLDAQGVEAFWTWHEKGMLALEAGQYGWMTLLLHPRARALSVMAAERARWEAQHALRHAGRWVSAAADRSMEFLGGRVPPHSALPPVVRRTNLHDTMALPASSSSLPGLYRVLFRLAPVEDRRFLIGREHELAGLEQAVKDWSSGRFAACLLIGARGSGKTSLLNCAVRDVFAGLPWIRAEFRERILSPAELDAFLRGILQLPGDADLQAAFAAQRRVLILEEAERIYLRKVGGFAAAHYLTNLIHRTASTTFWVIVMNDRSFRVLDCAADLQHVFSHRINATSVSRTDLESAILERHRLSGMRLEFAPPPAGDPRVNRVKRLVGLEQSAQTLFFDSLFQQSAGTFRSAFQLWLSSIERVEGETLKIRQPFDPAFGRFRSELTQEDQFTLLVIQEHGSLTQGELADVLSEQQDRSYSRMQRLTALGLIESDPDHPGIRVTPAAQRFVDDLLRRANLT